METAGPSELEALKARQAELERQHSESIRTISRLANLFETAFLTDGREEDYVTSGSQDIPAVLPFRAKSCFANNLDGTSTLYVYRGANGKIGTPLLSVPAGQSKAFRFGQSRDSFWLSGGPAVVTFSTGVFEAQPERMTLTGSTTFQAPGSATPSQAEMVGGTNGATIQALWLTATDIASVGGAQKLIVASEQENYNSAAGTTRSSGIYTTVGGTQLNSNATTYSGIQSVAITTATTTVVKSSGGIVGTLSNASGAVTGTITIYDNTAGSGKTIWSATLAAGQVLPLGIPCGIGITIVTAAADAIAVSYV